MNLLFLVVTHGNGNPYCYSISLLAEVSSVIKMSYKIVSEAINFLGVEIKIKRFKHCKGYCGTKKKKNRVSIFPVTFNAQFLHITYI